MAGPSKTVGTSLLAIQTIATATVAVGSAVDVSTKFSGCAYVQFGRTVATALTNAARFRIEASASATLDGQWYPMYEWISDVTAAISVSATAGAAGAKSITVTNTNYVLGDKIFCQNGTLANSEFVRLVTKTSSTSINVEDNLVNAQTTSVITSKAEWWAIPLDLSGVGRIRLVVGAYGPVTGQTTVAAGTLTTLDTIA